MLKKTQMAVGKYASVPGKFWHGCPAADKDKRFLCVVVEFVAMHDFGEGRKGSGFQCRAPRSLGVHRRQHVHL